MRTGLWIVLLVVVAWTSFLIGYSVSALTGMKRPAVQAPAAAGTGGGAAGGYGTAVGGEGAPAGSYGTPAGGYGGAAPEGAAPKRPAPGAEGGTQAPAGVTIE